MEYLKEKKAYADLDGADFKRKIIENKNAVILDVRTSGEFNIRKIAGAINIDIWRSDFHQNISKLDKRKIYFVYCRSGNRSAQACNILSSMGLQTYNLTGGINNWTEDLIS